MKVEAQFNGKVGQVVTAGDIGRIDTTIIMDGDEMIVATTITGVGKDAE